MIYVNKRAPKNDNGGADCDWRVDDLNIALLDEDLPGLDTQRLHLGF